jgi:hypothetical protein
MYLKKIAELYSIIFMKQKDIYDYIFIKSILSLHHFILKTIIMTPSPTAYYVNKKSE